MRPLLRHLALCIVLVVAAPVRAQIGMPGGVALSPFPVAQNPANHVVFGDGSGGLWAVFQAAEPGGALYVNHVNADGSQGLGFSGARALTVRSTSVNTISAGPDGLGGAVLSWFSVSPTDSTSLYIALRYHHIDANGDFMTPDTGRVVSTVASSAMCVGDGAGGGYVVWEDVKSPSNPDIVGQHYDASGVPTWPLFNSPTGFNFCPVVGIQRIRGLVEDGAGGAYAIWSDSRTSTTVPLYAARLLPSGVAGSPWPSNGLRITPITSGIRIVGVDHSAVNGLYLAWRDLNIPNQLTGQHVLGTSAFAWNSSGQVIATQSPSHAEFVPASLGDVFVTWGGQDIRCQRLTETGVRVWPETQGRVMVAPAGGAVNTRTASDLTGGQRLLWSTDNAGQTDVVALHVDGAGSPLPGEPLDGTTVEADPVNEEALMWVNPGSASPTIVWLDAGVIRARRLDAGTLDVPLVGPTGPVAMAAPYPNPVRDPRFVIRFRAPAGEAALELLDVTGRRVHEQTVATNGAEQRVVIQARAPLAPGVYTVRLRAGLFSASRRIVRLD